MMGATNFDSFAPMRRMNLSNNINLDLTTTEDLLDAIALRQEIGGKLYFFCYEDDEDPDIMYFFTNMEEGDIDDMMETFDDWMDSGGEDYAGA